MSIHGACFDEGQSGNCGIDCRVFLSGDCSIENEIVENCIDEVSEELLLKKFGKLRLAVLRAQNSFKFCEEDEIKKMILDGTALDYLTFER